jgi:hypothetical protein
MTAMDFGSLFGLDMLGDGDKCGSLDLSSDSATEFQDILNLSLQENGITQEVVVPQNIVSAF